MKRLLFIYNAHAGRQRIRNSLADILDVFAQAGYEITAHPTQSRGDATGTAAASAGYDRVVCCGGDGTLNETVSGLMSIPEESRPALGYIPAGSTNDFSRNLNLPKELTKVAAAACGGLPRPCDLGRAEGSFFTYVAAFGLFTDVSYATPQAAKNLLGHFAYVLQGAGKLFNVPSFHMKVESAEGFVTEGDYIYGMVSNTVSVGGLMNLPRDVVKLDDGRFEVLLVREPKNLLDWQEILTALTSQKLIGSEGIVTGFQTEKVTFTCDKPVAWTVDGEFGGERAVTRVENLPRAFVLAYGE